MDKKMGLFLFVPISLLILAETLCTLFVNGIYRGPETLTAQAMGQDLFTLLIAFPVLIINAIQSNRGNNRAKIILLGVMVYLVYTYAVYSFEIHFNSLFLVYVALFGLCLYSLINLSLSISSQNISISEKAPIKFISIFLAILAVLFYLMWLSEIVPAILSCQVPESITDNNTSSNVVYVLDMAWILPAMALASRKLWLKEKTGILLAGAMLIFSLLLIFAIIFMAIFMLFMHQPLIIGQVVIFGIVLFLIFFISISYLRSIKQE